MKIISKNSLKLTLALLGAILGSFAFAAPKQQAIDTLKTSLQEIHQEVAQAGAQILDLRIINKDFSYENTSRTFHAVGHHGTSTETSFTLDGTDLVNNMLTWANNETPPARISELLNNIHTMLETIKLMRDKNATFDNAERILQLRSWRNTILRDAIPFLEQLDIPTQEKLIRKKTVSRLKDRLKECIDKEQMTFRIEIGSATMERIHKGLMILISEISPWARFYTKDDAQQATTKKHARSDDDDDQDEDCDDQDAVSKKTTIKKARITQEEQESLDDETIASKATSRVTNQSFNWQALDSQLFNTEKSPTSITPKGKSLIALLRLKQNGHDQPANRHELAAMMQSQIKTHTNEQFKSIASEMLADANIHNSPGMNALADNSLTGLEILHIVHPETLLVGYLTSFPDDARWSKRMAQLRNYHAKILMTAIPYLRILPLQNAEVKEECERTISRFENTLRTMSSQQVTFPLTLPQQNYARISQANDTARALLRILALGKETAQDQNNNNNNNLQ